MALRSSAALSPSAGLCSGTPDRTRPNPTTGKTSLCQDFGKSAVERRERADAGLHHFVRESDVEITHRSRGFRVQARGETAGVAGNNHAQSVVLVRIGFRVFVDVNQATVVEQSAVTFRR